MPDNLNKWKIRLEAARDAQVRSRYSFIVSTIVSVAFIIGSFNTVLSWERFNVGAIGAATTMQSEVEKEFVQNQTIKNDLLGIKIDMDDAPILGSLSLLILQFWFLNAIRRENRVISALSIDACRTGDKELMEAVFHGIASYLVFTSISDDDNPVNNLGYKSTRPKKTYFIKHTYKFVLYLPLISISVIVSSSLLSLIEAAFIHDRTKPLYELLGTPQWIQVSIATSIGLMAAVAAFTLCSLIVKFEEGTGSVLKEFSEKLPAPA